MYRDSDKFLLLIAIQGITFLQKMISNGVLHKGGVAQMVERSLSMREVPGSIPGASNSFCQCLVILTFFSLYFTYYIIPLIAHLHSGI